MKNMNIKKVFADQNSVIDLSSLGDAKGAKVSLAGPDMNITTSHGSVIIVNGALYSSIKGNNLIIKFKDKSIPGSKVIGSVDLKDIQLERIDSSLVDAGLVEKKGNGKNRNARKDEELQKQLDDAEGAKKEADKAKEEAEKAKEAAEKAISEAFEIQNSSKQIEEMLQNFLSDNVAKDNLAQQDNAIQQNTLSKVAQNIKQDESEKITPQPLNKNTGSGRSNSSKNYDNQFEAEPVKEKLKISFKLAAESNSGSKDDSITNFTKPQFIGSTSPNATVVIKINGISVGQVVADKLGNFTFTAPEKLADGTYNLEAEATTSNAMGSTKLAITIDSVIDKPSFELSPESSIPGHQGLTATLTPSIIGTAEENAKVNIYVNDKLITSVDVDKNGKWSYGFKGKELIEGDNNIKVVAVDKAGNQSEISNVITIDTIPPEKPTIELDINSDSGVKDDNITNSTLPTFIGVAEPGATVSIYIGIKHLGDVVAAKDGSWSYTLTEPLKDGEYHLTATATDIAGHTSETSDLTFTIDTRISYFSAELDPADDSGIVGDNVTNNSRPTFIGKSEPNTTINVKNSETGELVVLKANAEGEWQFAFTSDSAEGVNNLVFTVEDVAGNQKDFYFSYVIDTVAPTAPTVSLDDFVTLPNGIILSGDDTPALVGTAEPKSTISILREGKFYASIDVDSNGSWSYQFNEKLPQGVYDIEIVSQDIAGNKSSAIKYSFTIQTEVVIPKAELDAVDDSGEKGDWITNKHNALTLLGTAGKFATVNIIIDGKAIGVTTADEHGNWTFDISRNLSDDVYTVTVEAVDPLGNTASADYQLTIDSFTPIPTVMLHDSADSGVKGDLITRVNTPLFTGSAEPNAKVSIYVDGILSGEAIAGDDGVWNFQFSNILPDGMHEVMVKAEDIAGNKASSSIYNFQILTHTQKPTIELVDDTGLDNTDHIINEKRPALTGTAAPYSIVKLYIDNALVAEVRTNKDGVWDYTLKPDQSLADGDHKITATVEDIAGNIAHSDAFLFSVDTTISIPVVSLSPDSESGILDDNLTNITKPTLILRNIDSDVRNVQVWDAISNTQIGIATQQSNGTWTYTFTSDLIDGLHQVYVKAEDIAGNKVTGPTFDFTIDTTLSIPVISLIAKDDTGVADDNITNINKPDFIISGIDSDAHRVVVQVTHNGVNEQIVLTQDGGNWVFTPASTWDDGSYTLQVTVEDEAGNIRQSTPLTVKVDTQIAINSIELINDTGIADDNITNDMRPHFRVEVPNDVNMVRLSIDGGKTWGSATKNTAGIWDYSWPTNVTEGSHILTVEATDIAGNKLTQTLDFTIDTLLTVPTIALDSADDSGVTGDNITNSKTPGFTLSNIDGDVIRVALQITHNGKNEVVALTQSGGNWVFTPDHDWADGSYTLQVTVEDEAGNIRQSTPLTVKVDTQIAIDNIELINDTGMVGDNLTNDIHPQFRVTVPDDVDRVRLSIDGGKTWVNATPGLIKGSWDYTWLGKVPEGKHTLIVEATDIAGNTATRTLDFTVDTTLSVPTITLDTANDSGVAGDNITNEKTPGFTLGNIDADASRVVVQVTHNGKSEEVELTQTSGNWVFTPTSAWADGNYTLTVKVTDEAGNTRQSAPLSVKVDTQVTIDGIVLVNDSGITSDNITNEVHPHFRVTVPEDVNVVRLSIDGGTTWINATPSSTGIWDYTWPDAVPEGKHTLVVEAIDIAGNKATQALGFTIDTTLSVPTITLDTANDSGVAGDNITNEKTPGFTINGIDADAIRVAVQVTHNGTNQEVELTQIGGQWHFTPASNWVDGNYTLTVKVEDRAGNVSQSAPLAVTIDTQTEINNIVLVNDTGMPDDNLTNALRPEFRVTVPEDVNAVRLSIDGGKTWVDAKKTSAGVWDYSWTTDITEGVHTLTVEATDIAGNTATRTLDFTVDTTLSVPTITLDTANDSGVAGDNITNEKTPGFTINGIDTDASRVVVTVTHDGKSEEVALTKNGGGWTFTPDSAWTDGRYTLTVTVEDDAGNIRHSAPLAVTVDTRTGINSIELVNDSGVAGDNLTNEMRPHFRVEVPEDVNAVRLSIDGGKTWMHASKSAAGVWDYSWLTDVPEGTYTLAVEVTDIAGNTATRTLDFTIDTTLSMPTITLDNADDTGERGDNLTNRPQPNFILQHIDADVASVVVSVTHDGTTSVFDASQEAGGWRFTPDRDWTDGSYTLSVTVTDKAGNVSQSTPLTVTVDTHISIGKVELINDSGVVGDNMTNDIHPQFRVTVPEDVNSVRLSIDGGATWVKATQGAAGIWDYTWPDDVKDGKYTLQVEATDKAGNTITRMLEFTIDTTLTTPTIALDHKDDSGTTGDNLTNAKKPGFILGNIDVDASRVVVQVTHDGKSEEVALTKSGGQWSFTPTAPWGDGSYTLTVTVEDKAGNVSHSAPLTVTVDTQTAINSIALVNDTGIPDDNLTNAVRPHFRVTVPDDVNAVRLSIDGGKTWVDAKRTSAGVWDYSWLTDVTEGVHTLTVEATDVAGNTVKETMGFTVDTTLSVPLIALDSADDSGVRGDELTRVNRPTFLLDNIDNDARHVTVEVQHGSTREVLKATQGANGRWSFTPAGDWADGQYTLTVKVEDEAGNIRQSAPLTVTVDTQTAIDGIELVNDHGISGDNLTNALRPEFRVTTPGDVNTVRLSLDGDTNWVNATKNAAGVWEYNWPGDVGEGKHTLTVEATDAAGNTATRTLEFTIDTTLSVPVITLDSADDSGNRGDNVTSVRSPGFTIENIDPDANRVTVQIAHDGSSREVELTQTGGRWHFTPDSAWTDGSYTLTVKVEDNAGNIRYSTPLDVKVDTHTSINHIELVNDNGVPDDNLTNEMRPQFRVTVPEDVTVVRLSLDGSGDWVNATAGATKGEWNYSWPSDVGEGKHVLTVEVTDAAGNTATKTLDFRIDTRLSEPVITLNSADDTGVPGDGLTSRAQPSFTLQDIDADVVRVTVSVEHGGRT
ncbi:Ig-like domain repeat protein, partial [Salmonella enterica]|nr:Ig-like domain repeat protein [Salmonella enterica]